MTEGPEEKAGGRDRIVWQSSLELVGDQVVGASVLQEQAFTCWLPMRVQFQAGNGLPRACVLPLALHHDPNLCDIKRASQSIQLAYRRRQIKSHVLAVQGKACKTLVLKPMLTWSP